jgi:hypothetical protein
MCWHHVVAVVTDPCCHQSVRHCWDQCQQQCTTLADHCRSLKGTCGQFARTCGQAIKSRCGR